MVEELEKPYDWIVIVNILRPTKESHRWHAWISNRCKTIIAI
jgi:hypothetical protein